MIWTPTLIREVVKAYGDAMPTQRVTLLGKLTDNAQRKQVDRWPKMSTVPLARFGNVAAISFWAGPVLVPIGSLWSAKTPFARHRATDVTIVAGITCLSWPVLMLLTVVAIGSCDPFGILNWFWV